MKAQITKVNNYWRLTYYKPDRNSHLTAVTRHYLFPEGAFRYWQGIEKQIVREHKAWAKLMIVNQLWLDVHEIKFINKLCATGCHNITKRQYGYLSGILERQNGK